ncbi:MAG: SDR family NAD(P)-dependent oxidoreductase [Candidatus Tectomicrobia bacterium]|uniref:SDR family NAD(P)-dependent oxidoreductase n=1 Tax=Tectimicrobiota bacterium TaxID=2528274 RepID=A0A933GLC5_UNCTE|nr:SDR family NAD(P)-dependent oxidoreductase [Candidatus Tectomicrobia bacterium]
MFREKLQLQGKVAIVTGGGTGLGKYMSLTLAQAGADMVIAARRVNLIEETAEEVRKIGRKALSIPTDVTDPSQVKHLIEKSIGDMGKVDILINNAGIVRGEREKPIWEITDEEWFMGINTNLTGTFYCCRAIAKHMVDRQSGKIINLGSGYGLRGARNNYMYCTAKAGVINFTRSLAVSMVPYNVQVNCIIPGMVAQHPPETDPNVARRKAATKFVPMGRIGEPMELGPLALFLASDLSNYIIGEIFPVDGAGLAGGLAPTGLAPLVELGIK